MKGGKKVLYASIDFQQGINEKVGNHISRLQLDYLRMFRHSWCYRSILRGALHYRRWFDF